MLCLKIFINKQAKAQCKILQPAAPCNEFGVHCGINPVWDVLINRWEGILGKGIPQLREKQEHIGINKEPTKPRNTGKAPKGQP